MVTSTPCGPSKRGFRRLHLHYHSFRHSLDLLGAMLLMPRYTGKSTGSPTKPLRLSIGSLKHPHPQRDHTPLPYRWFGGKQGRQVLPRLIQTSDSIHSHLYYLSGQTIIPLPLTSMRQSYSGRNMTRLAGVHSSRLGPHTSREGHQDSQATSEGPRSSSQRQTYLYGTGSSSPCGRGGWTAYPRAATLLSGNSRMLLMPRSKLLSSITPLRSTVRPGPSSWSMVDSFAHYRPSRTPIVLVDMTSTTTMYEKERLK